MLAGWLEHELVVPLLASVWVGVLVEWAPLFSRSNPLAHLSGLLSVVWVQTSVVVSVVWAPTSGMTSEHLSEHPWVVSSVSVSAVVWVLLLVVVSVRWEMVCYRYIHSHHLPHL